MSNFCNPVEEFIMQRLKSIFIALLLFCSLLITPPAWADLGKYMKTPEYQEVTQAITDLLDPTKATDLSSEAIQQKMTDLRFQKYIMESADDPALCRNETGKTIAIYARPKKSTASPTLYYLGNGQETDDNFECTGVYLPGGNKVALPVVNAQADLSEPVALKFVPGTQLMASINSDGVLEYNAPAKVFKVGEIDWAIPTIAQADIEGHSPNAPVD
jgi:hypothetical protein